MIESALYYQHTVEENKWVDTYKQLQKNRNVEKIIEHQQKKPAPFNPNRKNTILTMDEIFKRCEDQPEEFVIHGMFPLGETSLVYSLPHGGKSSLLAWAMTRIATGQDFFGYQTYKMPIIYIHTDNQSYHTFCRRMSAGMDQEQLKQLNEVMVVPEFESIPVPLTPLYIEELAKKYPKSFIIIDTLRSAFLPTAEKGVENDASIVKYFVPLRVIAKKYNCHVSVVHHKNRTHGTFAGGAAIQGASDTLVDIERDEGKTCKVLIEGRSGFFAQFSALQNDDLTFTRIDAGCEKEVDEKIVKLIDSFPTTLETAKTQESIYEANKTTFNDFGWKTLKTFRNNVKRAEDVYGLQLVKIQNDTGTSKAARYFRVPAGIPDTTL